LSVVVYPQTQIGRSTIRRRPTSAVGRAAPKIGRRVTVLPGAQASYYKAPGLSEISRDTSIPSTTMQTHPLDANLPPPGLPVEKYCLSIWQRSTRQHELLHQGSTDALPEEAECVIIGSGIAGALTAYEILSNEGGPKSVVMLEAREACSGASGRNAGESSCHDQRGRG